MYPACFVVFLKTLWYTRLGTGKEIFARWINELNGPRKTIVIDNWIFGNEVKIHEPLYMRVINFVCLGSGHVSHVGQ